jgi:hypothetical protein
MHSHPPPKMTKAQKTIDRLLWLGMPPSKRMYENATVPMNAAMTCEVLISMGGEHIAPLPLPASDAGKAIP